MRLKERSPGRFVSVRCWRCGEERYGGPDVRPVNLGPATGAITPDQALALIETHLREHPTHKVDICFGGDSEALANPRNQEMMP
jgi:hypothetical protein